MLSIDRRRMVTALLVTVVLVLVALAGLFRILYVSSRRERKVLTREQRKTYGEEAPKRFEKDLLEAQAFNMLWLKGYIIEGNAKRGYITLEEAKSGYKIGGLPKQASANDRSEFARACNAFDASTSKTATSRQA